MSPAALTSSPRSAQLLRRWLLLLAGLFCYGLSLRLMIDAHVGVSPWDLFHLGVSGKTGLSVGTVSILVGVILVAFTSLGLREKVGPGTILNVVLIGLVLDWLAPVVPNPQGLVWQWVQFALGIVLIGFATGAYVSAGLGAGPRDSLMLGLQRLWGWPVARIRMGVELIVLIAGTVLGGPLGWGTLAFALTVGPSVAWGLKLFQKWREPAVA